MLIRSLEQFLACAGCSSNVPYCSSPRSSSALMLLCQLLKSDKLSIFSIASQKATNSLATKLLISMVSFPCFECSLAVMEKWTDIQRQPRVFHMIHFLAHILQPCHPKTLCQGNGRLYLWVPLYKACFSTTLHHERCHESLQAVQTLLPP